MMIGGKASSSDMKDLLTRIDRTLNRNGANELATQSLLSKSLREKGAAAETSEKMLKEIARQIAATNKTETPPTGDKPEPKGTS
jgi:hypothetical protein